MVGAKQFAMMSEILKSKHSNPLKKSNKIKPVKALSGSFLDKVENEQELPISRAMIIGSNKMEMPNLLSKFFSIAMPVVNHELQEHMLEEETEKTMPKVDERTINLISNRIFKNLKNYLETQNNNQKRNIEISIKL